MKLTHTIRALQMVSLLLAASAMASDLTPAQIAAKATPSVVLIKVPDGLGTGFVVSGDGRIATNVHVIRGAKQATVVTADGHEFKAVEVMAVDVAHDVAVLRIEARNLLALPLGDSASAKPGEHVVAIGHPLGLGNTVSDGLVSAVREFTPQLTMLQISAPISPGSSGGPVFNDRGEVIGISTLVFAGGQNLNFAVPINVLKPLLRAEKGIPLASYEGTTRRSRNVPNHPLALLDECAAPQLQKIVRNIEQAINVGAPLYNQGNIEACYRVYAAAALDSDKKVEACLGPRHALLNGVKNADQLTSWEDKAWAMRDAFDGVLAVAAKKESGATDEQSTHTERQVPHHALTVFNNCDSASVNAIGSSIADAINSGAPLYNSGNIEACYRIYEGAISDIERKVNGCPAAKQALQDGLHTADQRNGWQPKAWALRDAFDGIMDAVERQHPQHK